MCIIIIAVVKRNTVNEWENEENSKVLFVKWKVKVDSTLFNARYNHSSEILFYANKRHFKVSFFTKQKCILIPNLCEIKLGIQICVLLVASLIFLYLLRATCFCESWLARTTYRHPHSNHDFIYYLILHYLFEAFFWFY